MVRMTSVDIAAVNALDEQGMVDEFGDVAEHSPWVAQRAASFRPFSNRDEMIAAFGNVVTAATEEEQLGLIRAHPDLAGRAARAGDLTDDSRREQAGAGLDRLSDAQFQRFHELNDAYKARFGFPFIFAVKGATAELILSSFEERIGHSPPREMQTALENIARILRFRLEDRVQ